MLVSVARVMRPARSLHYNPRIQITLTDHWGSPSVAIVESNCLIVSITDFNHFYWEPEEVLIILEVFCVIIVVLLPSRYISVRGQVSLSYKTGMQQTTTPAPVLITEDQN